MEVAILFADLELKNVVAINKEDFSLAKLSDSYKTREVANQENSTFLDGNNYQISEESRPTNVLMQHPNNPLSNGLVANADSFPDSVSKI
jgi:hypothetical protein